MKSIKYIGFYNHHQSHIDRICALSAINKMNYVINCLNDLEYSVDVISPSWLNTNVDRWFLPLSKERIENNTYIYAPSFITKIKPFLYLSILLSTIWLLFYLLFNCKKNEKIIVYHSLWIIIPIYIVKKIKKIKVILEVEEVYSDVNVNSGTIKNLEKSFLEISDFYIFSNDLLKNTIDKIKLSIVLYGTYNFVHSKMESFNDGRIHLVYSGVIDSYKKGAFNALRCMKYLNDNYVLHILGFGEIEKLKSEIEEHNKLYKSHIIYEGEKKGEEFLSFLGKCDIGLSTQNNVW